MDQVGLSRESTKVDSYFESAEDLDPPTERQTLPAGGALDFKILALAMLWSALTAVAKLIITCSAAS